MDGFLLSYNSRPIGSFSTARECADEYRRHQALLQPTIDPTTKLRYSVAHGLVQIGINQLMELIKQPAGG
jgi:hypothetical protein